MSTVNTTGGSVTGLMLPWFDASSAATMLALQWYDRSVGNTQPNITVRAVTSHWMRVTTSCQVTTVDADTATSQTIMQVTFDAASDAPETASVPFDMLPPTNASLWVAATGTGQASAALSMRYVPATMPQNPMYRGISVQRFIQAVNASDTAAIGPPLVRVPLAAQVRVTVQVMTPDALASVVVRVPMPGGLEPLDSNVLSSVPASSASTTSSVVADPGCPSSGLAARATAWWPTCPQLFVMPQAVELRFVSLPAGTFEASFLAVAASVGQWALPPASATALGEPEVGGLSSGGGVTVCDRGCAPQSEDAGVMQGCPGDCSGAGWCDTRRGVCVVAA